MLIAKIIDYMENYQTYLPALIKQIDHLKKNFFSGAELYDKIKG